MGLGRIGWICFVAFLLVQGTAKAATFTLAWDAEESGTATGYRVFAHDANGSYDYQNPGCDVDSAALQCDVTISGDLPYHFVARAYNAEGESANSNEVIYFRPLRIQGGGGRKIKGGGGSKLQ